MTRDDAQATNVDGVYAVGDVCGRALLTPVAIAAGRKLVRQTAANFAVWARAPDVAPGVKADRLFGGKADALLDYENIPTVVFRFDCWSLIACFCLDANTTHTVDRAHSHPPIGTIGLTEREAQMKFGAAAIRTYSVRCAMQFNANANALRLSAPRGVRRLASRRCITR